MPVWQEYVRGINTHLDDEGRPYIIRRVFTVENERAGMRIDQFLKEKISRLSRNQLQKIILEQVSIDGKPVDKVNRRLRGGQEVVMERQAVAEPQSPMTVSIVHKDSSVCVVNKPAGLTMHASAKFYFNTLTRVFDHRFPGEDWQMCHRIDRETSGLVVFAQGKEAAAHIKKQFAKRRIDKTYVAIVQGHPQWPDGHIINKPLQVTQEPGAIRVRVLIDANGLPSQTAVRVVAKSQKHSIVLCRPKTGRQHQIRVHLASEGHPIAGDKLYAHDDELFAKYCAEGWTDEVEQTVKVPRHCLHASSLTLNHPISKKPTTYHSPLPADMREVMEGHYDD